MARHFPHWLKAYCRFTETSEAPLAFHFWTGVSTIAGVLRRRVWKDEHLFKWTPNFYIIFVGPAGIVTKSTTLGIGYDLLKSVKVNGQGIHFGPDSMTWHGLAKKFQEAVQHSKYKDKSGTEQTVLQSALTCSISELGTFLRPDDRALVSFLTDVWDGKERPFDHTTKDSGELKIENAWLNVIGATTPEWMQDNFPAGMLSQGLGSRIVFVYANKKRHLTAYPSRTVKPTDWTDTRTKLIEDLNEIAKLGGPFELTDDAYKWGEEWYKQHNDKRDVHMASERFAGYLARKQTHLHKIAMVLCAAQRDDLLIQKDDLEAAELLLKETEQSMIKVFESVGVVDEAKHMSELVAFVKAYKFMTSDQLYRLCYNIMSEKDYKQALRLALEGGMLEVKRENGVMGIAPKQPTVH